MENYIFWCEIGLGFEQTSGTPPPRIPKSTAPGGTVVCIIFNYCVYVVVQSSLIFQFLLFYFPLFLGVKINENECGKKIKEKTIKYARTSDDMEPQHIF